MTIILLLAGLGLIVLGADWLVDGASAIARKAGVSEFVIGLTIVGFGTSCPELVVSLTGAIQGNADIAIGNVIGSNVFNILLILGCSSVITPLSFGGMSLVDAGILIVSCLLLLLWAYSGRKCRIDRWEGALMLLVFAAYYCYLFEKP
ncbi:MAG: sodium:calcium antiporter [Candidatus Cryptobacteroides sp.]